jgi:hypothetical protein
LDLDLSRALRFLLSSSTSELASDFFSSILGFTRWSTSINAVVSEKRQTPETFVARQPPVSIRRLLAGLSEKSLEKRGAPF